MDKYQIDLQKFLSNIEKTPNCWIWKGSLDPSGYGRFYLTATRKKIKAHRYSYQLYYHKKLTSNILVRHTCDNPSCVNPKHLLPGTDQDNANDCVKRDREAKGEKNGWSKLTEEDIMQIRRLYDVYDVKIRKLATTYNVGHTAIHKIVNRERWTWLK